MKKLTADELGRPAPDQYRNSEKIPVAAVLDNVRSGHNTGSVFRTADAFNIAELILVGITPAPPSREVLKTALGATETVLWKHFSEAAEAIDYLKSAGYSICVAEQTDQSEPAQTKKWTGRQAIIFGNEVDGVSREFIDAADAAVEIPQAGTKHSLNVAVAAGILLYLPFICHQGTGHGS